MARDIESFLVCDDVIRPEGLILVGKGGRRYAIDCCASALLKQGGSGGVI